MPELPEPDGEDGIFECGMTTCPNCDQPFMKRRGWQVFCSAQCRMQHHQQFRADAIREYRNMVKQRMVNPPEDVNRG